MDILKTIKYYNNRPVLVLQKHEVVDFYQILVDIEIQDIDLDHIAESFRGCDACMVGHKSTCYCDESVAKAYDVVERIIEDYKIKDSQLFYVPAKDLKDTPFEWRENKGLVDKIKGNKDVLNGLIDIVAENKSLIKQQEKQLSDNKSEIYKMDAIVENRKSLTEMVIKDYDKLKSDIEELESKKKLIVVDSEVKIEYSEYEKLLKRDEILSALEIGGVDNWEWYDESLKGINDEE